MVVQGFTDENVAYSAVAVQRIAAVVMASVVKMLDVLGVRDEVKSFTHANTERR